MRLAVLDKTAMNFHAKEKSSRKAIEKSSMKYSVARSPIDCTNLVTHFLSVAKLRVDISMWNTREKHYPTTSLVTHFLSKVVAQRNE